CAPEGLGPAYWGSRSRCEDDKRTEGRRAAKRLPGCVGRECALGMMSLVQVAPSRVRAEPLTLESLPWPPQYRLLSPRAISRATARRLTRTLKKRSTGAAPMNPMNPTIIDPNIVPKINPTAGPGRPRGSADQRGGLTRTTTAGRGPATTATAGGNHGAMPTPRSTSPYQSTAHKAPAVPSSQGGGGLSGVDGRERTSRYGPSARKMRTPIAHVAIRIAPGGGL